MIALLQRAASASVEVEGTVVGSIGAGVLVFLGVVDGDDELKADRLAEKVANYRILADETGRPNRSLLDEGAAALVVSQFTLAADTRKGRRADYGPAAAPDVAERLYGRFAARLREQGVSVETGRFGAHMTVALVNDGPVTFWLEV